MTPTDVKERVPARAGLVLGALILGALVCNINLAVANVALPDIGRAFNAPQSAVNLVAVGCTLGLAMSVLYFGALGDRYGRKLMLTVGLLLTLPASAICAWAPNIEVLAAGRLFTGVAAGMAYPTTLALITALWGEGPKRIRAIALWSGVSAGAAVIGPAIAGFLLQYFWWGSVFLIAVPPAVVALVLVVLLVPAHVNESNKSVDHLGGVLSVFMVGFFVLGLSMIAAPGLFMLSLGFIALALVIGLAFFIRQSKAANPLYDLQYAKRRLFWVPAIAGMIVFGSLMGVMFIGQQFLQNVLQYSTFEAGVAILPASVAMFIAAPFSARLIQRRGSRITLMIGLAFLIPAFLVMLITWKENTNYGWVALGYILIGFGAGIGLTPASRSLTVSVPVRRVGMASGTTDLERDFGGSVMQALFGSLLTAGYAYAFSQLIINSPQSAQISESTQEALTQSYSSAANLAEQYPQYAGQIVAAARQAFLEGANVAYTAGVIAILIGAGLVWFVFPKKQPELELEDAYAKEDVVTG